MARKVSKKLNTYLTDRALNAANAEVSIFHKKHYIWC